MNRLEDWLRWAQTAKTDLLFWENLPDDCRNHDVLTTPLSYSHMTIIFGRMPSIETKFVKSFEGIRMGEREYESKCDVPDDETNCGFSPSSIGRTRSIFLPEIFCRHTFLKSYLLSIHKRDVTYKVLRNRDFEFNNIILGESNSQLFDSPTLSLTDNLYKKHFFKIPYTLCHPSRIVLWCKSVFLWHVHLFSKLSMIASLLHGSLPDWVLSVTR